MKNKRIGLPKLVFTKNIFRVLVFPSCNEPGLEIINALAKSNKVILFGGSSVDIPWDPSRLMLKRYIVCPNFGQPDFQERFKEIITKHRIHFVFPTVDILIPEFAKWNVPGVHFITCNAASAALVFSKSKLYRRLSGSVPTPRIFIDHDQVEFPAYAKPDVGSGGKGSMIVKNQADLIYARAKKLLVTEYLSGEEYTVDAVNDTHGTLLFCNVRVRGKIGRSIALGTKQQDERQIEQFMDTISRIIRIEGPWFAQFKKDRDGIPKLMEINCRMGGSSTLTRLSGVNIPLMSLYLFAGYPVTVPNPRKSLLVNRVLANWCESPGVKNIIWDLDDTLIRKDGKVDPDSIAAVYDFANRGFAQFLVSRKPYIRRILKRHNIIYQLFKEIRSNENKIILIGRILEQYHVKQHECAFINDSTIENISIQSSFPDLHVITPDSLAVLGKELIG